MTKRFVMFSSLFAVVAMFLGLMVTGCSDSDRDVINNNSKTMLRVAVGFQGEILARGYDCLPAEMLRVSVYNSDAPGVALQQTNFGETPAEGVTKWNRNGDYVEMEVEVAEDALAEKPDSVVVTVFDANGEILGAYVAKDVDYSQPVVKCDFTEADQPEFVLESDFQYELVVLSADEDDNIEVGVGETVAVTVAAAARVEGVVLDVKSVDDFIMEADPENENISIDNDKHTITGSVASDKNPVTVTWHNVNAEINVVVVDGPVTSYDVTLALDGGVDVPDFEAGEVIKIEYTAGEASGSTVLYSLAAPIYNGKDGEEVSIKSVTWQAGDTVKGEGVFEPATVTISAAGPNVVTVSEWTDPGSTYPLYLDYAEGKAPDFDSGDFVQVQYRINEDVNPTTVMLHSADSEICKGAAGDRVYIDSVTWVPFIGLKAVADSILSPVIISAGDRCSVTVSDWRTLTYAVTLAYAQGMEIAEGDKVSVKFSVDGQEQTVELDSTKDVIVDDLEEGKEVTIASVRLTKADKTPKEAVLNTSSVTVSATEPNVVTVESWKNPMSYSVMLNVDPFAALDDGDWVTIRFQVNGGEQQSVTRDKGYLVICTGFEGDLVDIIEITKKDRVGTSYVGDFSPKSVTISSSANSVYVRSWTAL